MVSQGRRSPRRRSPPPPARCRQKSKDGQAAAPGRQAHQRGRAGPQERHRGRRPLRRLAAVRSPPVTLATPAGRALALYWRRRAHPPVSTDASRAPANPAHRRRRRAGADAHRSRARSPAAPGPPRRSAADPLDRPLLARLSPAACSIRAARKQLIHASPIVPTNSAQPEREQRARAPHPRTQRPHDRVLGLRAVRVDLRAHLALPALMAAARPERHPGQRLLHTTTRTRHDQRCMAIHVP